MTEAILMLRNLCRVAAVAFVATAAFAPQSRAAGSFDGTWIVDVPSAGTINDQSNNSVCPALRIPVRIHDNQVSGSLERVSTTTGAVIVEAGQGRLAAPVTGAVAPDGTVDAQWQNYHAIGRLGPQFGRVTIQGECGPRVATAIRINPPGTTEGQGSTTAPQPEPYGASPPNPAR